MSLTSCDRHEDCIVVYDRFCRSRYSVTCPQCTREKELEAALKEIEELKEQLEAKE